MQNRIQLLNVAVDVLATKAASEATIGYLQEESSKVVYFLNSETLMILQNHEEWKKCVEECALVLPGTVSVSDSINEILGHKRDPFFLESYFDAIWDYSIETGLEILLVAQNQDRFTSVQENIHEKRPYLTLSGVFLTDKEESLDHIVNEINSVAPDILVLALEEDRQLELLQKYRNQMNAGLMFFTDNVLFNKAVSEAEVPESIQKLKIDNLYKWFRKGGRLKAFFNNFRIKFQLKKDKKKQEL